MVVQLFKNIYIYEDHRTYIALEKLYILVHTPLSMKLRAKNNVRKMYSFFLSLYSFLMVAQLSKIIHMKTTEFVQLWKKLYILVQTPLSMKLGAKDTVPKMYSFFLWLYSVLNGCLLFKNIYIYEDHRIYTALEKLYILVHTPLSMKLRAKNNVQKMYSFFLSLYSFLMVAQLSKIIHMRTTGFVQLWKKLYILVQTPLSMKLGAKDTVPKMYSFFLWLYSVLNGSPAFQKNIYI